MTTNFTGTVNASVRLNAPTVGTLAGDLALAPAGANVAVAAGKTLTADAVTTSSAATDLTLNATGPNINCSGKTLTNVGGLVTPVLQAVTAGPAATANATPLALLTLPIPTNTCYLVEISVAAASPTGAATADSGAWFDRVRVTNRAGVATLVSMQSSSSADAGLAAATVVHSAAGANLVTTVTGLAGLGVRWSARASYVAAAS